MYGSPSPRLGDGGDERPRALGGRAAEELVGRAGLGDLAGVEEADPVGTLPGEAHLVGDHQHGEVGLGRAVLDMCCDCSDIARRSRQELGMASLVVRRLSEVTKERLRQRAARHRRSLEAEVRAILERAAAETPAPGAEAEGFPDWFIRMTSPGIDLGEAIDENRPRKGS
jgi:hypothetical protein